jgi:vacuolar-type H+-ATPase subunit H
VRARDLLERFRPAGTPGAAGRPGVPADRVAELSAELGPVLELLDDTIHEAARIRADGARRAEEIRRDATERSRVTVDQARRRAEAERSDAAARVSRRSEADIRELLAQAEREADAIRSRARSRMPRYVDDVLAVVRTTLTDGADGRGPRP